MDIASIQKMFGLFLHAFLIWQFNLNFFKVYHYEQITALHESDRLFDQIVGNRLFDKANVKMFKSRAQYAG